MSASNPNAVLPDASSSLPKKEQVAGMFDAIAPRYDFLNHALSLGIDRGWRRKAIASIASISPKEILDVATGTGDLAILAAKSTGARVIGVDISEGMLEAGRKKLGELSDTVSLQSGDSEALAFQDGRFDAVMCAYGVRNFENLEAGLREMARVLRPGGRLAILEFSRPKAFPVKQLYGFYFRAILPLMGRLVSKHSTAYSYLPQSVQAFPEGRDFVQMLQRAGFAGAEARPLTFGITTLYTATK